MRCLATFYYKCPDQATLERLAALEGSNGDIGSAVDTLSQIAKSMNPGSVEREFNVLFIGVGRGEVLPYASYYPHRISA
jgi:TorA maturation chaperone TorD